MSKPEVEVTRTETTEVMWKRMAELRVFEEVRTGKYVMELLIDGMFFADWQLSETEIKEWGLTHEVKEA